MTIDEAIKHAEERAEDLRKEGIIKQNRNNTDESVLADRCIKYAEEHEQLAEWLKELKQLREKEPCKDKTIDEHYWKGFNNGIRTEKFRETKRESCEDAISRQAVLDQTYFWSKDEFLRVTNPFDYLRKRINSLTPVTPQQKMGRWINQHIIYANATVDFKVCSECRYEFSYDAQTGVSDANYCPNCGAIMTEESEEIQ